MIVNKFVWYRIQLVSDFRPELLGNAKRSVCQCVIEHTGHHGFNPAWKEAWLGFADEDRL